MQAQEHNIGRILEVFPEYGRGFLAACLDDSRNDPEVVINQLLEGSLPKHLSKMDPHLTSWQPKRRAPTHSQPAIAAPSGHRVALPALLHQHHSYPVQVAFILSLNTCVIQQ